MGPERSAAQDVRGHGGRGERSDRLIGAAKITYGGTSIWERDDGFRVRVLVPEDQAQAPALLSVPALLASNQLLVPCVLPLTVAQSSWRIHPPASTFQGLVPEREFAHGIQRQVLEEMTIGIAKDLEGLSIEAPTPAAGSEALMICLVVEKTSSPDIFLGPELQFLKQG
ncbi:hypothetical protein NDU88_002979 [Pleurodeles waltl]|uniref:Nudix hydrolase domain-containing protein n=1 Tax=Pleurodeles waltl TaxID=8319 RepID=A0AAV7SCH0_PLEWA|nr:hypothetical protein NDU88_002979 [Pleurodeles waltl]